MCRVTFYKPSGNVRPEMEMSQISCFYDYLAMFQPAQWTLWVNLANKYDRQLTKTNKQG